MVSSPSPKENGRPSEEEIVTLTDESGQTLNCLVEKCFEFEGQDYLLLLPVDTPVEIFAWVGEEEDQEEEEAIPVEDVEELNILFPIAKAVLEEQNLTLKRTAVALTVEGDLPELPDEENADQDGSSEADYEEFQWLATFYHEDQEYGIYTPLDPLFVLARFNQESGLPELLSPEELKTIEPILPTIEGLIEDGLFEDDE